MFETLYDKVAFELMIAMLCGALGAWAGSKYVRNFGAFIGLVILAFAGIFITNALVAISPVAGVISLAVWTGVIGLMSGPAMARYKETIGAHSIAGAFLGTSGAMAVCGLIATFSGINFGAIEGMLTVALWGLIIFGVVSIFVYMSRTVRIVESLIGMAVFTGYFLVDFWRLAGAKENTWQFATQITMNLYLDFWNFFLYLLQLIEASKHKSHALNGVADHAYAMLHAAPDVLHHGVTLVSHGALTMFGVC